MHSPDMTQEHIARIRELFPNCVTEARGKDGSLRLSVDFDLLRQELSDSIVEGPQERYHLDWPGKREAMLAANAPIAKALRPCREESVDFDTTKNLFIEGDNLDALKLLQETYLGKVKMIYIDPPYNTGNDFIYNDDFAETSEAYLSRSNQKDEAGNRLVANPDSNGRFHSDWLSMMYPRLKLARNLLADDGFIFISIDSNEINNICLLMNEIFGSQCLKNIISVRRGIKNVQAQFKELSSLALGHEYILLYSKNIDTKLKKLFLKNGNGRLGKWDTFWRGTDRPTMRYELFGQTPVTGQWRWEYKRTKQAIDNYTIYVNNKSKSLSLDEWYIDTLSSQNIKLDFVRKNKDGVIQYYVPPTDGKLLSDNWMDISLSGNTVNEFSTEKNIELLERIVRWLSSTNDIILDFFAGSSTTAHAVMQLNAEDGGNRRFIMVQLPEACDAQSEAAKAGYGTIAEISKERIRRAGKKILEGDCHEGWNRDVGFRVLKVDTSNMADVFYTPDALQQNLLDLTTDNIKPGRTPEDLLFQVLLDWGVELTLPIRKESIQGKTVFFVDDNALVACFDRGIDEALVRELAACAPLRVVFRDNGFVSDAVKINVEQIFRQLSPGTEVRCL